ncbi:helix-turn-helix transcriptional regulator [Enterococcus faecalis]|nr:helix-turn-helix transcriptional regulator [Enterococcus faecalis]
MEKKQINTLVKQLRMDVGLKQKEARTGVMEAAAYSRFENGKKSIDFTTLLAILSNLKVSLKDFIEMYIEPNLERTTRDFFVS